MKNTKKLLVAFMGAALISTSFTSCIDNGVSPVVDEIYQNQADLIAAQTALKNADTAYKNAQTALQNAQVEAQEIANAQAQAINALVLTERAAAAAAAIAESEERAQQAQEDLERAQLQWQAELVALQANIDEANLVQAEAWLADYSMYNNTVISLESQKIDKVHDINAANIALAKGLVDKASGMVQLQTALADIEAAKAAKEAELAVKQALLADPATYMDQRAAIEADIKANEDEIAAKTILIAEIQVEVEDAEDAIEELLNNNDLTQLSAEYTSAYNDLANALLQKISDEEDIEDAEDALEDLQDKLDNYDTLLADLEADLATAEGVLAAAEGVEATKEAEEATALAARQAAIQARNTAQGVKDDAEDNFNDASANLGIATTAYTAANSPAPTTTAEVAALADAQAAYDYAKTQYELDNSGFHWGDYNVGADGVLGIHTDGTAAPDAAPQHRTWVEVTGVDVDGVATFGATQYDGTADLNASVPGNQKVGAAVTQGNFNGSHIGKYFDVELDDMHPGIDNEAVFDAAALDLDDAQDDLVAAEAAVVAHADALATAEADYLEAKANFETREQIVIDAEADLAAAITAHNDAIAIHNAAVTAHDDAEDAVDDAQDAVDDAQDDVDDFEDVTKTDLEDQIAIATAALTQLEIDLATSINDIADLQADVDAAQAALDAASGTDVSDAQAVLDGLLADQAAIQDDIDALDTWNNNMQALADAIENNYETVFDNLEDDIADLEDDIADLEDDIIDAQKNIDDALLDDPHYIASLENNIAQLEAQLAVIEAEIALNQSLANKYLDLVNTLI